MNKTDSSSSLVEIIGTGSMSYLMSRNIFGITVYLMVLAAGIIFRSIGITVVLLLLAVGVICGVRSNNKTQRLDLISKLRAAASWRDTMLRAGIEIKHVDAILNAGSTVQHAQLLLQQKLFDEEGTVVVNKLLDDITAQTPDLVQ